LDQRAETPSACFQRDPIIYQRGKYAPRRVGKETCLPEGVFRRRIRGEQLEEEENERWSLSARPNEGGKEGCVGIESGDDGNPHAVVDEVDREEENDSSQAREAGRNNGGLTRKEADESSGQPSV